MSFEAFVYETWLNICKGLIKFVILISKFVTIQMSCVERQQNLLN